MARDKSIELMPDGAGDFEELAEGDVDIANLTVDFSSQEADSEARIYETLPTGAYHVKVTEVSIKQSTSEKNRGKPYYAFTMVIQDGKYANRKVWTNVMLWAGAGYTLAQLIKAMGRPVGPGTKVPTPDEIIGYDFIIVGQKRVDKYQIEQGNWDGEGPKPTKFECTGFKKWDGESLEKVPGQAVGGGSLLP
jgi:hypothetical protein